MKRSAILIGCGLALLGVARGLAADKDPGWPRAMTVPEGKIVIYQPQAESLDGNVLKGRAAVSITLKGQTTPIFGAIWFESQVQIDRDARTVQILNTKVPRVRIADAGSDQQAGVSSIVARGVEGLQMTISYDLLLTSLDAAAAERRSAEGLRHEPPKILFETSPAVLVVLDGDPQLRPIPGTGLMKVVNTPFFIALEPTSRTYWLYGGTRWFTASDVVKGQWTLGVDPPADVTRAWKAEQESIQAKNAKRESAADDRIPRIIVSTEPTELIMADGEPEFTPLPGNELLAMSNTEDDLFMDIGTQDYYVLLSGRWFRGKSLHGPWEFVQSDRLPKAFAQIPEDSAKGDVLTFVAGTQQAQEAVMDAEIPQTAAVKRSEAKVTVTYDGQPRFEPIPQTAIDWAVNTDKTVLRIGGRYYCCDQAVWFVADGVNGPWVVCDRVPGEVQAIPPESPCYNVKYVYVYDSTPDVVYVGYTPGYLGCYPCYGTIIYGTGWHYPCYVGPAFCYSRPWTWGFHANYNPWTGWCFGMSWSPGWASFGIGFGHFGGWWGPCGYSWRHHDNWFNHPVVINRPIDMHMGGTRLGGRVAVGPGARLRQNDLYRFGETRGRVADAGAMRSFGRPESGLRTVRNQPNNVLADREGNVLQRDNRGKWLQREQGQWRSSETGPSRSTERQSGPQQVERSQAGRTQAPASSRQGSWSPDREQTARTRGETRTRSFQGRPTGSGDRGSTDAKGGRR